jgi:hypothetical protein
MGTVDIWFGGLSDAMASKAAQELETVLLREGVPRAALKLVRSSNENMDLGSILSIDFEMVGNFFKAAVPAAQFTYYTVGVLKKFNAVAHARAGGKSLEITKADADSGKIEELAATTKDPAIKA